VVLFWQQNGLSLTEIMVLQSIFSVLVVLLEIPTGYFADLFGRKNSLIIGSIFSLLAIVTYAVGGNFFHFLIAEIFWAFNMSFISGSDSAFIFDSLKQGGREKKYKKIWGNSLFYGIITMALANIIGGFIGKTSYRLTFWAMIPFVLISIIIAYSFKEPARSKVIFKKGYLFELLQIIKKIFTGNNKLTWLIIYSAVVYSFNQSALWFYQPYLSISGLDVFYFGIVFASFQLVAALSSKYAHIIERKLGQRYSIFILFLLVGISYMLMSNFIFLFSFSFAFLHQFVRGFSKTVITDYINKLTSSDIRATVISTQNMIGRLIYALFIPFFGWIADVYSIINALTVIGVMVFILGGLAIIGLIKSKVIV